MSTIRHVPPEGGFYLDVPGIWPGGATIEIGDDGTATRIDEPAALAPAEAAATPAPTPTVVVAEPPAPAPEPATPAPAPDPTPTPAPADTLPPHDPAVIEE